MRRAVLVVFMMTALPAGADGLNDTERAQLDQALACIDMSIAELSWDKRPIDDPFRLTIVNKALDEPLSLAEDAERAERDFFADPVASGYEVAAWMTSGPAAVGRGRELASARRSTFAGADAAAGVSEVVAGRPPRGMPASLRDFAVGAADARRMVSSAIPAADTEMLRSQAARMYLSEDEETWDSTAVRAAAGRIDMGALRSAFQYLASVAGGAKDMAPVEGRPRTWTVEGLTVALGSPGPDRFDADVVLDPGGDDLYEHVQFVIDLGGDDTYKECASGLLDAGLIVDLAGNDTYISRNVGQGGAVCGVSLLVDRAGDDTYVASQLSQGSGVLGVGMLFDLAGNDSYRGARFVQGFGGVWGLGVLSDVAGNDEYWAGGTFTHDPLLPENYQSLSQGFGFGLRPDASGGVGILADHGGNDVYHAEVFGQGASYWFSLGILVDTSGHDKYDLFQYGQGAGIHLSAGVLLDRRGSDAYSCNNGVAQGSGHDWGVGLLWDQDGPDCYQGSGMSQGGANANGIGMLIDRAGNDSYAGWNVKNQGDSFFARGTVGLGVLLDLQGEDKYTHGGKDGATWTRGTVGVGRDVPDPPKEGAK